eukprot:TRINITY_DN38081_c0_g2_i1.p1 TRINITY_DN38081_c0_g2~~TRINITY_DN38081_c0_g2_i1.p1  ORF type:complete len:696 (-),score=81.16 TRINITY_DN38081_c0_g2_i1:159-2246(-)
MRSRADCGYMHLCLREPEEAPCLRLPSMVPTSSEQKSRPCEVGPVLRWLPKRAGFRPIANLSRSRMATTRGTSACTSSAVGGSGTQGNAAVMSTAALPLTRQGSLGAASAPKVPSRHAQRDALRVLSHLRAASPHLLGCSLLSQAEVHTPIATGLGRLIGTARTRPPGDDGNIERGGIDDDAHDIPLPSDARVLHVAVADLANCYEHIDHATLRSQVTALPLSSVYRVEQLHVHRFGSGNAPLATTGMLRSRLAQLRCVPQSSKVEIPVAIADDKGGLAGLVALPQRCPRALRRQGVLATPAVGVGVGVEAAAPGRRVRGAAVVATVVGCVASYRVMLGTQRGRRCGISRKKASRQDFAARRLLALACGIPQGLSLSPFLCGLRMAAGDAAAGDVMPTGTSGFVVRLVDDFLVVSFEQKVIEDFLSFLARPDNPYGGKLHDAKVVTSFELNRAETLAQPEHPGRSGTSQLSSRTVPWAGLTLTPEAALLNVSTQGARSAACIADTLALRRRMIPSSQHRRWQRRDGRAPALPPSTWRYTVDLRLRRFLDLKLSGLLLDESLNSRQCVLANIARTCGLCALRLSWLVLRRCPRLDVPAVAVATTALRLARRAAALVDRRSSSQGNCVTVLQSEAADSDAERRREVRQICMEAFQAALRPRRRHPSLGAAYAALGRARRHYVPREPAFRRQTRARIM